MHQGKEALVPPTTFDEAPSPIIHVLNDASGLGRLPQTLGPEKYQGAGGGIYQTAYTNVNVPRHLKSNTSHAQVTRISQHIPYTLRVPALCWPCGPPPPYVTTKLIPNPRPSHRPRMGDETRCARYRRHEHETPPPGLARRKLHTLQPLTPQRPTPVRAKQPPATKHVSGDGFTALMTCSQTTLGASGLQCSCLRFGQGRYRQIACP